MPVLYDIDRINRKALWLQKKRYNGLKIVTKIRFLNRNSVNEEAIFLLIKNQFNIEIYPYLLEVKKWILPQLLYNNPVRIQVEKQHFELKKILYPPFQSESFNSTEEFANLLEENIRFEIRILFPLVSLQFQNLVLL
jgi:hypothetical protein